MTPAWFLWALLLLNVGASLAFLGQRNLAWSVIYAGAATIQAGCLVASR